MKKIKWEYVEKYNKNLIWILKDLEYEDLNIIKYDKLYYTNNINDGYSMVFWRKGSTLFPFNNFWIGMHLDILNDYIEAIYEKTRTETKEIKIYKFIKKQLLKLSKY